MFQREFLAISKYADISCKIPSHCGDRGSFPSLVLGIGSGDAGGSSQSLQAYATRDGLGFLFRDLIYFSLLFRAGSFPAS